MVWEIRAEFPPIRRLEQVKQTCWVLVLEFVSRNNIKRFFLGALSPGRLSSVSAARFRSWQPVSQKPDPQVAHLFCSPHHLPGKLVRLISFTHLMP